MAIRELEGFARILDHLPSMERVGDMRDAQFGWISHVTDEMIKSRSDRGEINSLIRSEVLRLVEEFKTRLLKIDFDNSTPDELIEFYKFKGQIDGLIQTGFILELPDKN